MQVVLPAKKQYFLIFYLFVLWAILIFVLRQFNPTGFSITLTLFFFIFTPGFALSRFFIGKVIDLFDRFIVALISGLGFNFLIFFLAILLGLNINQVLILGIILLAILFLVSAVFSYKKLVDKPVELKLSYPKDSQFWFNFLGIVLTIGLVAVLSQVGAEFTGDPLFHLALWRKIFDGASLNPQNLTFVQGQINPLYAYPVWHIFMIFLAKIVRADIFSFWMEIQIGLSLLAAIVWWWVLKQILPNKKLVVLAFLLFIAFVMVRFMLEGKAYLFRRLPIPDTIEQLMFLPLIVGVGLKYLFKEKGARIWLGMAILTALFMAIIHLIQLIYFWMIFFAFGVGFAIFYFRDKDYKEKLLCFAEILVSTFAVTLPYLLLLQAGSGAVSSTASAFLGYHTNEPLKFKEFSQFRVLTKYAYLAAPLLLIFVRRHRSLLLAGLLFCMVPIVYFTPLNYYLIRIISHSAVNRIYSDFEWSFVIWAMVLGFVLLLVDRLLTKLPKIVTNIYTVILGILAIWLLVAQWRNTPYKIFVQFFTDLTLIIDKYHWLIFLVITAASLMIFLWQIFKPKIADFFEITDFKHNLAAWLGILIITLLFLSPTFIHFKKKLTSEILGDHHFFARANNPQNKLVNIDELGGSDMIEAIGQKVPAKSVFDTNAPNNGFEKLPMLVDQYMSNYWSQDMYEFNKVYSDKRPTPEKMSCLAFGKIENLLVVGPSPAYFRQEPTYFSLIYHNQIAELWSVNLQKVSQDFQPPVVLPDEHPCRLK